MRRNVLKAGNRIITKLIASTLIVNLTCANFLIAGDFFVSCAVSEHQRAQIEKQTNATLNKNVTFNAYFATENEKSYFMIADVNSKKVELNIDLQVKEEGYLKNAVVSLETENEEMPLNYKLVDVQDELQKVETTEENKIRFRQIEQDESAKIKLNIIPNIETKTSQDIINQVSKVKLTGTYINTKGKETEIVKDIKINLGWTGDFNILADSEIVKYIPLDINGEKKVFTQFKVQTGLEEKENNLPIKNTQVEFKIPAFNGIEASKIDVAAISTEATNNQTQETLEFSSSNWTKDEETKTIKIKVENKEAEDGTINKGQGMDEYLITCIYPKEAFETISENEIKIDTKVNTKIETYDASGVKLFEKEIEKTFELKEEIGKLLSFEGNKKTETIGKGKLYANVNAVEKQDTAEYEYAWNINVGYKEKLEAIKLQDEGEMIVDIYNQKYDMSKYSTYRTLIVNKESFMQVLGQDGKINIYNKNGEVINLVKQTSNTNENGDFEINIYEELPQIIIETTKPVAEGNLVISVKKQFTSKLELTKAQIENFEQLIVKNSLLQKETDSNEFFKTEEKQIEIPFEETRTKAKLTINKDALSTVVNNEDVEFKIELGNNKDTSDLYVDPVFDIELPKYIEEINIKESKILYDDELIIKNIEQFQKLDGTKVIRITLDGIQTKFSTGSITNGTNIILNTDLKVNILTPSTEEQVKMYYYNMNTKNYENLVKTENGMAGLYELPLVFSAPTGLLSISNWAEFDNTGRSEMSVNQGTKVEQIDIYQPAKISKMDLILINNTGSMCDGISVLGRIPYAGNKSVLAGQNLGTTIDTNLRSAIAANGIDINKVKIYYSENGDATKDLSDSANGWAEIIGDITKVKSFLIVINDYQMMPGETLDFSYYLELVENMTYNNSIFSNFATYYTENSIQAQRFKSSESDTVGLTTGVGPDLKIEQEVSGANENDTVNEYGLLKYSIKVTNNGTTSANNVKITNQIPKWTTYVKSLTEGNTSYELTEKYPYENESLVKNGLMAESIMKAQMELWHVIDNGDLENGVGPTIQWTVDELKPGETVTKEFEIYANEKPDIPTYYRDFTGFKEDNGKYYIVNETYNGDTEEFEETSRTEITKVPDIEIKNTAIVTADNFSAELKSESKTLTLVEADITATETVGISENKSVQAGDEISFTVHAKNKSKNAKDIKFEKVLPEGLIFENAECYVVDDSMNTYEIPLSYDYDTKKIVGNFPKVKNGWTISIIINTKADTLEEGVYKKEIQSNSKFTYDDKELNTNTSVFNVKKAQLKTTITSSSANKYLKAGEEVEYKITVENIGEIRANPAVQYTMPEGLSFMSANYNLKIADIEKQISLKMDSARNVKAAMYIEPGDKCELTVKVRVMDLEEQTPIVSMAQVYGDNIETQIETIDNIIEKSTNAPGETGGNGGTNPSGGNNQGGSGSYSDIENIISGTAFLDENENGQRDKTESLLKDIKVLLIDSNTGNIAVNTKGEQLTTVTDLLGNYSFNNVKKGKYIVVFLYDTAIYTVTQYKLAIVDALLNSDVIEREFTYDGKTSLAGVTDTINLERSISNIDIGLITKDKFDLKLDKVVTKINIQNKEGTKTHNYQDTKLAQVPITGKYLSGSTMIVEYKIKVTNEGNVAGYAKNIVDYMPKQYSFSSELNPKWYLGNDNNLYTTALENELISPGQTKDISLVLTKKINDTSSSIINNNAEIKECYNERGLKDKDSTAGNNIQGEDDTSSADVLITIRTGGTILTVSIVSIIILVIIAGTIFIIRKKFNKQ